MNASPPVSPAGGRPPHCDGPHDDRPTHAYIAVRDGVSVGAMADLGPESEATRIFLLHQGFALLRMTMEDAGRMLQPGSAGTLRAAEVIHAAPGGTPAPAATAADASTAVPGGEDDDTLITVEEGWHLERGLGIRRSLKTFQNAARALGYFSTSGVRRLRIRRGDLIRALTAHSKAPDRRPSPQPVRRPRRR